MRYRGEMSSDDKNDGNDLQNLAGKKYKADHEPNAAHEGATVGVVGYDGSEFFVRFDGIGGRSWCFRHYSYTGLCDDVHRFFPRVKLSLKRSRSAELALSSSAIMGTRG